VFLCQTLNCTVWRDDMFAALCRPLTNEFKCECRSTCVYDSGWSIIMINCHLSVYFTFIREVN